MNLFAVGLLLAQTWVSPIEQSYGPYLRPAHGGDAAVAPARGGALLVWSEAGRIRLGLLDSRAELISPLHELPATDAKAVATMPVAAFDGASFLVAWNEEIGTQDRTMAIFVGADGTPIGMPRRYAYATVDGDPVLRLAWDGRSYRLFNGSDALMIGTDGAILLSHDFKAPESAAAKDGVLATTARTVTGVGHCGGPFRACNFYPTVEWTIWDGKKGSYLLTSGGSLGPTRIAAAGEEFAVAWTTSSGRLGYLLTSGEVHHVAVSPDSSYPPGLACDETQCLLAYSREGDVHALLFPPDRLYSPEMLAISATERTERAPQVHLLGPHRFLVTYRSDGMDGKRLAGRLVTTEAPVKRRAVR